MKKILVLYAGVGHGHKKIAENIQSALVANNNVELLNLFDLEDGPMTTGGSKLYTFIINRAPWLWTFFYSNKLFLAFTLPFRSFVAGFKSDKLFKYIDGKNFDLIICTEVNASAVVSNLKRKRKFKGQFAIAFSDPHFHPYWLFRNADLFFANIPEQKEEMIKMGYNSKKILVCGITVQEKKIFDRPSLKLKYKIKENQKLILVVSGSFGYGLNYRLVETLKLLQQKIIVICGTNAKQLRYLSRKYLNDEKVLILGYVDLFELYPIADYLVGKPGGLTLTESLLYEVPLVVATYLPGQEELNLKYLLPRKLVLDGRDDLKRILQEEMHSEKFAKQLRNNSYRSALLGDGSIINKAVSEL